MRCLAAVLSGALVLAGCADAPVPADPPPLPPPAEPAVSPPPAVPPAGQVVPVGALAEGAVADSETGLVAVGVRDPNALALVDGRTGEVRTKTPLPGHLRHLQLAGPGGPVLVPAENSDSLVTVDLPSGQVGGQVPTGVFPHDATRSGNGLLFAANEFGGTVAAVRDGAVVQTFTGQTQPGGLAAVGDLVGVVDVRQNDLSVYDAQRLERIAQLPAGAGPTHVLADRRGQYAVADTRGDAIIVYASAPQVREVGRLDLPGSPYGITYDPVRDRMWVTLTGQNEVVGLDLATSPPTITARIPTVRQPNTVAVDSGTGRLFVTGTTEGVLQLIDP
ncbi:hypothetical protein CFN78_21145 [Amycolatopsis antarctica]|uniref:YncE family protein n=1 Tax=Amycolatopsis antarctica TaxID=1854586 RepID=A0A263CYW2_9PSEU|nr:hypothetical protein CFN78_21145 [Amycolatopsis antarctica]